MRSAVLLLSGMLCAAQLSSPLIGYVRTGGSELRPLHGVAGAFVLGEPLEREVLSASFTAQTGLVKKESELLLYRAGALVSRQDVPPGRAVFRFTSSGEPAAVRFESGECREWKHNAFELAPEGNCTDMPDREQIGDGWFALHRGDRTLVQRGDETWQLPE